MVWRCDQDCVNIGARHQLPKIVVSLAIFIAIIVVHHLDKVVEVVFVHITRGHNAAIRLAHKGFCIAGSLRTAADDAQDDLLRRRFSSCGATVNKLRQYQGGRAGNDKTSPADFR
jgi:hypothetical protein